MREANKLSGYDGVFAKRIRYLLDENKKTQQALADQLGIKRQAVSNYCNGSTQPNLEKLLQISKCFNVSIDYLLGKVEVPTPDITIRQINERTGLSEKAIKKLSKIKDFDAIRETLFTLNAILEHEDFEEFIKISHSYRLEVYKDFTMEDEERFSKIFYCRPSDLKTYLKSASMKTIESFLMNIIEGRSNHPKSPNPKRLF